MSPAERKILSVFPDAHIVYYPYLNESRYDGGHFAKFSKMGVSSGTRDRLGHPIYLSIGGKIESHAWQEAWKRVQKMMLKTLES